MEPSPVSSSHPQVRLAERIARRAHAGQVDKAGRAYIEHPARAVAAADAAGEVWRVLATLWLHDTVEDVDGMTTAALRAAGVDIDVVAAVDAITHRRNEPNVDYFARVRSVPFAATAKRYDVADNADPERLALLDAATADRLRRKYERSLSLLGAEPGVAASPIR